MNGLLLWLGRLLGVLGAVVCVAGLAVRVTGQYTFGGIGVGTLFLGGTAVMVAGCLCLLLRMDSRP